MILVPSILQCLWVEQRQTFGLCLLVCFLRVHENCTSEREAHSSLFRRGNWIEIHQRNSPVNCFPTRCWGVNGFYWSTHLFVVPLAHEKWQQNRDLSQFDTIREWATELIAILPQLVSGSWRSFALTRSISQGVISQKSFFFCRISDTTRENSR